MIDKTTRVAQGIFECAHVRVVRACSHPLAGVSCVDRICTGLAATGAPLPAPHQRENA